MITQLTIYLIFLGVILGLILLIFIINRKRILAFFKPNDWVIIEMLERDNNIVSWLQHKDADLQFSFNEGIYNMFDLVTSDKETIASNIEGSMIQKPSYRKVFSSIYREGRLAKLYYKEGEQNPLDFRNVRIQTDAQQSKQIGKIQISRLIHISTGEFNDFLQKYGIFILIGMFLVMVYLLTKSPTQTPVTPTP